MSDLTESERDLMLTKCACGHTINDHGSVCWMCMDDEAEKPCEVGFEEILVERLALVVAARREADAETIRGLQSTLAGLRRVQAETVERYQRLRADVEALAGEYLCEWETRTEAGTATKAHAAMYGAAHRLRAILARHERPEGDA